MLPEPNLPLNPNPCCGYIANAVESIEQLIDSGPDADPQAGDLIVCLNCGAVLVFIDPKTKQTRPLRRGDLEGVSAAQKQLLRKAQKYIRRRGWIPREARRRSSS